jgi:catechol 2,3-dioxygenase-like lactoylglutathione lyase family enzyme
LIDHVGFEVTDLERSQRFYDAVLYPLGARRMLQSEHAVAYGVNGPQVWIVMRSPSPALSHPRPPASASNHPRPPVPGYGHLAVRASGRVAVDAAYAAGLANGGTDDGAPGMRPQYGAGYYAAYLRDPDDLRVEVVSRR